MLEAEHGGDWSPATQVRLPNNAMRGMLVVLLLLRLRLLSLGLVRLLFLLVVLTFLKLLFSLNHLC